MRKGRTYMADKFLLQCATEGDLATTPLWLASSYLPYLTQIRLNWISQDFFPWSRSFHLSLLDRKGGRSQVLSESFVSLITILMPWLVWLGGLSAGLRTKGLPVRAHAWVAGQVPSRGCATGNHTSMFLSLSFSLFLCCDPSRPGRFMVFVQMEKYSQSRWDVWHAFIHG